MTEVGDFLKRAADHNGFHRDRFEEKRIPTDHSNLIIMSFWGDIRSMCVASSLLMHRYCQEMKGSKYFILASWPGFQGLFPYVDEYWSLTDDANLKKFYEPAEELRNKSDLSIIHLRNLNEFFRNVIDYRELLPFYKNGLTNSFFSKFQETKVFLPFIPSATVLGKEFSRELAVKPGYKVFIHPSLFCKQWVAGRSKNVKSKKEFWIELVKKLLDNNYIPVIWQNNFSHDISQDFIDRCIFIGEQDIVRALSAMRATGCVLDIFNNLSRLAILARCPFVSIDERSRNSNQKEYEFDDLCGFKVPKEYIYTFSTIVTDGISNNWNHDIFPSILNKLDKFMPLLDRDTWPSTGEFMEVVSYKKNVRKIKAKKLGVRLLKINKD